MKRLRFALSSDQLELLMAFENSNGLTELAETMAKDASVVSRNLQRIAENCPVLKKVKGRWELTPLGSQVNQETHAYLNKQNQLFSTIEQNQKSFSISSQSALVIINAQNGLFDLTLPGRKNSEAEENIQKALNHWRAKGQKIIHVKHISEKSDSIFYKNARGSDFLEFSKPQQNEVVIEKTKSSAFTDTELNSILEKENITTIVLAGFTANECIDATAREAATLGFETYVIGDATATFDLRDPSGKIIKAERVHQLTLANINALYARVLNTADVLA